MIRPNKGSLFVSALVVMMTSAILTTTGVRAAAELDNAGIRVAVQEYLENPAAAADAYGPIEEWSTWKVTDMSNLFLGASTFDANLDDWDVSSVTTMNNVFAGCESFQSSTLERWDVNLVADWSFAFMGATNFTGTGIGAWSTGWAVTMEQMFFGATRFVGPERWQELWDVSRVTNMQAMFFGCTSFDQPLNQWNVASVRSINSMFKGATNYSQQVCWKELHPAARCYQCFCDTDGAAFDQESCPTPAYSSIVAYSQACDPNDVLNEMVDNLDFDRPDDFMGGFVPLTRYNDTNNGTDITTIIMSDRGIPNDEEGIHVDDEGDEIVVIPSNIEREASSAPHSLLSSFLLLSGLLVMVLTTTSITTSIWQEQQWL